MSFTHAWSWCLALLSAFVLHLAPLNTVQHISKTRTTGEFSGAFYHAMVLHSGLCVIRRPDPCRRRPLPARGSHRGAAGGCRWLIYTLSLPGVNHLLLWSHMPGLALGLAYSWVYRKHSQKSKQDYNNKVMVGIFGTFAVCAIGVEIGSARCDNCARSTVEAFGLLPALACLVGPLPSNAPCPRHPCSPVCAPA